MRPGLPPNLRFVGLAQFSVTDPAAVVEAGFPSVRVARIDEDYYTVERFEDGAVRLQAWPEARGHWNVREWLQSYGCEDAEWRHPSEFL